MKIGLAVLGLALLAAINVASAGGPGSASAPRLATTAVSDGKSDAATNLQGSEYALEDAASRADFIVVAKVTSAEAAMPMEGHILFRETIAVARVMKGDDAIREAQVLVITRPPKNEVEPTVGHTYICFLRCFPGGLLDSVKLAENSEQDIAAVSALLKHPNPTRGIGIANYHLQPKPSATYALRDDAVKAADLILLAKVEDSAPAESKETPGRVLEVSTNQILKGQDLIRKVRFPVKPSAMPPDAVMPSKGDVCIAFFRVGAGGAMDLVRVDTGTKEKIQSVTAGIKKEAMTPRKVNFPGSTVTLEDAERAANWVVVAKVNGFYSGNVDVGGEHANADLTIETIIKGNIGVTKILSLPVDFNGNPESKEFGPEVGQSYVVFLKAGGAGQMQFVKMVEVADAGALLKAADAAQPATTKASR